MDFSEYRNRRVVVTGASSGIGLATAQALIDLGAEVIGLSRRHPNLDLAAYVPLDLSDPKSIEAAVAAIGGHVDSLFNVAAAVPMIDPLEILKINFLGTRLFTEGVIKLMSSGGAIVNVSSDGGYPWRKQLPLLLDFISAKTFDSGLAWYQENAEAAGHPYAFGKEAMDVWTLQLSAKLIKLGIRINTVSPGAVQTPMLEKIEAAYGKEMISPCEQPSGRRSSPEESAWPCIFMNSDLASYINGADLAVDGGYWATLSVAGQLWG
jgi:NAD(P)-dependent dehydrogenase (short-subunit alcohol dehydrogenase family)